MWLVDEFGSKVEDEAEGEVCGDHEEDHVEGVAGAGVWRCLTKNG